MSVFGLALYGFEWRLTLVQALEFAKQTAEDQPRDGMIFLSTYGVIFLGTPHRGTHQAGLGILAASVCSAILQGANTGILRSLEQDSETLERIRAAFERMMTRDQVKGYSFVEEIPTAGVGMVGVFPASILRTFFLINC